MIRKTEYQLEIILKIKELREANNVSQKELSNLLEVAPGLIGSIESPKFPHKYTLSQIYKICHYFNITIEQLFISEEDFSKDRDIIDLLIFNIIRYGEIRILLFQSSKRLNPWNMFQAIEPTILGLEKHLKITSELSRTI